MIRYTFLAALSVIGLASACVPAVAESPPAIMQTVPADLPRPLVTQPPVDRAARILFVGNSYFYYNDSLHNHVQRMIAGSGERPRSELTFKSATIGGAALQDHAVAHLVDPANHRLEEPFQLVVMQGISSAALSEEGRVRFSEAAQRHAASIRSAGAVPVLYMTPAYTPPHRRYRPDMIGDVARLYIETANSLDALVIPVGLAFAEAYRRRPDIVLHKTFDGSHPSLLGTYLAAATVLASLYGTSPVGNPYDYFGEVAAEDAAFLQQVAQDTVREFYGRDE